MPKTVIDDELWSRIEPLLPKRRPRNRQYAGADADPRSRGADGDSVRAPQRWSIAHPSARCAGEKLDRTLPIAASEMNKINALYRSVKPGAPVTSADLSALGVSADLAVHYVRAGWLTRLARGVFVRPDMPLDLHASLRLLEHRVEGLPWAMKLDPKDLPTGSRQRWVGRSKEGLLVLKA